MSFLAGNGVWALISQSDAISTTVLLTLFGASIFSWTIALYKFLILRREADVAMGLKLLGGATTMDAILAMGQNLTAVPGIVKTGYGGDEGSTMTTDAERAEQLRGDVQLAQPVDHAQGAAVGGAVLLHRGGLVLHQFLAVRRRGGDRLGQRLFARKFGQVTALGRILDPFADKVIVCGTLILLVAIPVVCEVPWGLRAWMVVVVVGRELLVTTLRSFIEERGGDFSAKLSGKLKMVLQCLAAGACLFYLSYPAKTSVPFWCWSLLVAFVWSAVVLTVYSGIEYIRAAVKLLGEQRTD